MIATCSESPGFPRPRLQACCSQSPASDLTSNELRGPLKIFPNRSV